MFILEQIKSKSWASSFLIFWVTILVVLFFGGDSVLPEKYFWDSQVLMNMMNGGASPDLMDGSYYYTAKFFSIFGDSVIFVNLVVAVVFLCVAALFINNAQTAFFASFLLFPHLVLGLSRPQKELIVTLLSMIIIWAVEKTKIRLGVALCIIGYACYAIVRNYYALICFSFLLLFWLARKGKIDYIIFSVLMLVLAVSLLPTEFFSMLQGTRDAFNMLRPPGGDGNETIYFNPNPPDSFWNFSFNYLSAASFFLVPILYHQNLSALFLQIYNVIVLITLFYFLKLYYVKSRQYLSLEMESRLDKVLLLAMIFASHVFILLLFEPDLGSFMRHISSVAIYLLPLKMLLDEKSHS